jgi:transposase-like protein
MEAISKKIEADPKVIALSQEIEHLDVVLLRDKELNNAYNSLNANVERENGDSSFVISTDPRYQEQLTNVNKIAIERQKGLLANVIMPESSKMRESEWERARPLVSLENDFDLIIVQFE